MWSLASPRGRVDGRLQPCRLGPAECEVATEVVTQAARSFFEPAVVMVKTCSISAAGWSTKNGEKETEADVMCRKARMRCGVVYVSLVRTLNSNCEVTNYGVSNVVLSCVGSAFGK